MVLQGSLCGRVGRCQGYGPLQPEGAFFYWFLTIPSGPHSGRPGATGRALRTLSPLPALLCPGAAPPAGERSTAAAQLGVGHPRDGAQPKGSLTAASVLVAKEDDWPTGPEDGHILAVDLSPAWGEEAIIVDEEPIEGEIWYYAVFTAGEASDDDDGWYTDVVEGENGAVLDLRAPEDTGSGETGIVDTAPPDDSGGEGGEGGDTGPAAGGSIDVKLTPAGGGCGCAAGGSGAGAAWLLGLAGLAWRRRRAR